MKSPIKNDIIILSDKNEISMIKLELNKKDNTTKILERCSSSNGPKVDKVKILICSYNYFIIVSIRLDCLYRKLEILEYIVCR